VELRHLRRQSHRTGSSARVSEIRQRISVEISGSEQGGNRGDIVKAAGIGRNAKDDPISFLADVPGGERAALPFSGSECVQLLADARLGSVRDDQPMTMASSAGTALHRQSLPSLHPLGTIACAQRAGDGQSNRLRLGGAVHPFIVPEVVHDDQSWSRPPVLGLPTRPNGPPSKPLDGFSGPPRHPRGASAGGSQLRRPLRPSRTRSADARGVRWSILFCARHCRLPTCGGKRTPTRGFPVGDKAEAARSCWFEAREYD
jgi:hypothetical protein